MPLQWTKLHLPMVTGVDHSWDDRVAKPGTLRETLNCDWDPTEGLGALVKRNGFDPLPAPELTTIRGIHSTGREIVVADSSTLYGYDEVSERFNVRGPVSPYTGELTPLLQGQRSYVNHDLVKLGPYLVVAAGWQAGYDIAQLGRAGVTVAVYTTTGELVAGPHELEPTFIPYSTADQPPRIFTPRLRVRGDEVLIFAHHNARTLLRNRAPTALGMWRMPLTNIQSPPTHHTNLGYADTANGFSENRRAFDVLATDNQLIVATLTDDANIRREVLGPEGSGIVVVEDISGRFGGVALAAGGSAGQSYLVTIPRRIDDDLVETGDIGPTQLLFYPTETSETASATTTIYQGSNVEDGRRDEVLDVGLVANGSLVTVCLNVGEGLPVERFETSPGVTVQGFGEVRTKELTAVVVRAFDSGLILKTDEHPGSAFTTQPTLYQGEPHIGFRTSANLPGYETGGVLNLRLGDEKLVSLHSPGILSVYLPNGGLPSTVADGDELHLTSRALRQFIPDDASFERNAIELVTLTLGGPVQMASVGQAVMCSGAYLTWYDGQSSYDFGFHSTPLLGEAGDVQPDDDGAQEPSGELDDGDAFNLASNKTYQYVATWEGFDAAGLIHRSLPSNTITIVKDTDDGPPSVRARNMPWTLRPTEQFGAVVYKSANASTLNRTTSANVHIENTRLDHWTDPYKDFGANSHESSGAALGPPLYTNSNELGASTPEGCKIVASVSGRLWLGDFYRRAVAAYSKEFAPVGAAGDLFAPEFSDGFALLPPDGAEITGIGELDDSVVVLTENNVYVVAGRGPTVTGANADYALTPINSAGGCIAPASVVGCATGLLYRGATGIQMLTRNYEVVFEGRAVRHLTDAYPVVTSAVAVQDRTQLRFTCNTDDGSSGIVLVYDWSTQSWTHWEVAGGLPFVGACMHRGAYHAATVSQIWRQHDEHLDNGQWVPMAIETAAISTADRLGFQRLRRVAPLLARRDEHRLRVSIKTNYSPEPSTVRELSQGEVEGLTGVGHHEAPVFRVSRQKCDAFTFRVEDLPPLPLRASNTGAGFSCAGVTFEVGIKRGLTKEQATR